MSPLLVHLFRLFPKEFSFRSGFSQFLLLLVLVQLSFTTFFAPSRFLYFYDFNTFCKDLTSLDSQVNQGLFKYYFSARISFPPLLLFYTPAVSFNVSHQNLFLPPSSLSLSSPPSQIVCFPYSLIAVHCVAEKSVTLLEHNSLRVLQPIPVRDLRTMDTRCRCSNGERQECKPKQWKH